MVDLVTILMSSYGRQGASIKTSNEFNFNVKREYLISFICMTGWLEYSEGQN